MPLDNPDFEHTLTGIRLSLTTGVPIPTSDVLAATTVYAMPFGENGDRITLFDAAGNPGTYEYTQKSVAVPSTTNTPFDIFGYQSAGTLAIETLNWTNTTTRATAITLNRGRYCKSGDLTRLLLATGCTTGTSGQCEDSVGKRLLCNVFNRVPRNLSRVLTGGSASGVTTSGAYEEFGGTTDTNLLASVESIGGYSVSIKLSGRVATGTPFLYCFLGINTNSATGGTEGNAGTDIPTSQTNGLTVAAFLDKQAPVGRNRYYAQRATQTTNFAVFLDGFMNATAML